jgi:hypothetical protein
MHVLLTHFFCKGKLLEWGEMKTASSTVADDETTTTAMSFKKVRIFNAIFHARVINSFFLQGKIVRMGGNENSVEYRC